MVYYFIGCLCVGAGAVLVIMGVIIMSIYFPKSRRPNDIPPRPDNRHPVEPARVVHPLRGFEVI